MIATLFLARGGYSHPSPGSDGVIGLVFFLVGFLAILMAVGHWLIPWLEWLRLPPAVESSRLFSAAPFITIGVAVACLLVWLCFKPSYSFYTSSNGIAYRVNNRTGATWRAAGLSMRWQLIEEEKPLLPPPSAPVDPFKGLPEGDITLAPPPEKKICHVSDYPGWDFSKVPKETLDNGFTIEWRDGTYRCIAAVPPVPQEQVKIDPLPERHLIVESVLNPEGLIEWKLK